MSVGKLRDGQSMQESMQMEIKRSRILKKHKRKSLFFHERLAPRAGDVRLTRR